MTLSVCGLFVTPDAEHKPRPLAGAARELRETLAEPSPLDDPRFWFAVASGMVKLQIELNGGEAK